MNLSAIIVLKSETIGLSDVETEGSSRLMKGKEGFPGEEGNASGCKFFLNTNHRTLNSFIYEQMIVVVPHTTYYTFSNLSWQRNEK